MLVHRKTIGIAGVSSLFLLGAAVSVFGMFEPLQYILLSPDHYPRPFAVQSVDTMKFSRDMAEQILNDPSRFDARITQEISLAKALGVTHVAIATPYDARFDPVLRVWVRHAREAGLSVWFRGNFSGWEGWFSYDRIGRDEHERLLAAFLNAHPDLFEDGDIFSPCPECENGGPGDPRQTGDRQGYNDFLIAEKYIADSAFAAMGKSVAVYPSMNADIARKILTKDVARALGGTILIDHYASTPENVVDVVEQTAKILDAKVGLGEFGAPTPDINGEMTATEQAGFIQRLLDLLYERRTNIPLLNYWVLRGGSTSLLNDDGSRRPAYSTVASFYAAPYVYGTITNTLGEPISGAIVMTSGTAYGSTSTGGSYDLYLVGAGRTIYIERSGYQPFQYSFLGQIASSTRIDVVLDPIRPSIWYRWRLIIKNVFESTESPSTFHPLF